MSIVNKRQNTIIIVGMGYVGLPLAVAFAQSGKRVIGFDINEQKITLYKKGIDPTNEVGLEKLLNVNIEFTSDPSCIKEGKFIIVAVPTPIGQDKSPNLNPVESASRIVGNNMAQNSIVIFESTVYPGVTEDVCLPILERQSGMRGGIDFKIAYSPERINPGDKQHTVYNITKIVSGMDTDTLEEVAALYSSIVEAGVHRAPTIKVAEAAKVIENTQRDINIAFMNELAVIFDKLDIDTYDVLEAAGTKWNFLKFHPGLVGGHCIGVDPYYLTYKSASNGYISKLILAGRELNENMSCFVVQKAIRMMIKNDIRVKHSKVLILGLTFKANIPDLRNSKVGDIIRELNQYDVDIIINDCHADPEESMRIYGYPLVQVDKVHDIDCLILAVAHDSYRELPNNEILRLFRPEQKPIILDLMGALKKDDFINCADFYRL